MPTRPNIAFLPSHPAQLWLMKPLADEIRSFAEPLWIIRDKDITRTLADHLNIDYAILSRATTGLLKNAWTLALDVPRSLRLLRRLRIDLVVTKYGAPALAARLTGRRCIAFNDDDADVVPLIAWTCYPFAHEILAPTVTRMGRFDKKTRRFAGNFELFYLHPNRFTPDPSVRRDLGLQEGEPYAIIRLSALQAHHDIGQTGVTTSLLRRVTKICAGRLRLFISGEKKLDPEFEPHRFPIAPHRMHHALAFAEFLLGDSQTMTSEAAVLGTPALRLSSFVGRISYLEELQHCGLAFGFPPNHEPALLQKLTELLAMPDRRAHFAALRHRFLTDKIDPVPWFAQQLRAHCDHRAASAVRSEPRL